MRSHGARGGRTFVVLFAATTLHSDTVPGDETLERIATACGWTAHIDAEAVGAEARSGP
jgi:hypothetical protein